MKYTGFTSKIEIVDYGKTNSMLNLITIKCPDNAVTNVFTQFSEYVYDVNFDRNGFESITSKKRRSFITCAVKPCPSGRGYKARTASSDFRFFFHSIVYNY